MIAANDVETIIRQVEAGGLSDAAISELRKQYQNYHFTYCMEDDMDAHIPAIERTGFNLYFVDSADHCAKLTRDPEQGSGFVFAEIIDE